ncbi:MAG: type II secretion system F family protein [Patescibacteria group bacterium]
MVIPIDRPPVFLRFDIKEQVLFARRLSVYLSAGVPILEALSLLHEEARGSSRYIFKRFLNDVAEGSYLSSSVRVFSRQISLFAVSIIEVGEKSGTLQQSLSQLALMLNKQQALRRKLIGALIYPAIIVVAMLGICSFLILYAFPRIIPLFRGFGSSLPFSTRVLIGVSDVVSRYGFYIVAGILAASVAGWFFLRKPAIRLALDEFLLRVPIMGTLLRGHALAMLSRTLSTLLRTGIGIVPALDLASSASGNRAYAQSVGRARDRVFEGGRISDALSEDTICFPVMYVQMIRTGESTGTLSAAFATLAEHHEEEFDAASSNLTSLIEPVLMIVMGTLVGFIALAIMTPVYQITQDMHAR